MSLKLNFDYMLPDMKVDFEEYTLKVKEIDKMINERSGPGAYYLGWLNYAATIPSALVDSIISKANEFRSKYETLVVCGIGGSYLGARACVEAIRDFKSKDSMEIIYFGINLDPNYIAEVYEYLKNRKFCICVVSKSGSTTETAVCFRLVKELLIKKIGKEEASKAIVAITDKTKGTLRKLSEACGYITFELPDNIGGRFSVISPAGLFPIACAGINIKEFLKGVKDAMQKYSSDDINKNLAYQYALERVHLYKKGYKVEMFISYEHRLNYFKEWRKQLFDESEGKDGKAVLTSSATFTTDLHSLGQFIQEGQKVLYETTLYIDKPTHDLKIPKDKENLDGLNYLHGRTLSWINEKAFLGTLDAHSKVANIPNITIKIDKLDVFNIGHLFYFFMKSVAMSGYLLGVNPFNQPGVEVYKKNMFKLLGKPGY